jgi:uroporphyrinogen-III decarboxylase
MNRTLGSRQLVRDAFEGVELPRLPVIPFIFSHAARLEQIPLRRMYSDPTQYVRCLQNARKLYGYDAVVSGFDASLEAEMAGCRVEWGGDYETPVAVRQPGFDPAQLERIDLHGMSRGGRFGTVVESLRRIHTVSGAECGLAAVVTGPLQLAATLTGRDIVKELLESPDGVSGLLEATVAFLLKLAQVYCELELDIVVIADSLAASLPAGQVPWLSSVLGPLVNTVRFYNAFPVLLPLGASPVSAARLAAAGCDGIAAAGIDPSAWKNAARGLSAVFGMAVPAGILAGDTNELEEHLKRYLPEYPVSGVFLTTDDQVLAETPPENFQLLMKTVRG